MTSTKASPRSASDSLVAIPIVVVALAALIWWLVGRTLRPVEAIRREVADISGRNLHRRVPEPDTGDEIARLAQHHERDARPGRRRSRPPAALRRRRVARAAQPAHPDPHRTRSRSRPSRRRRSRRNAPQRPRRNRTPATTRRRPPAARPHATHGATTTATPTDGSRSISTTSSCARRARLREASRDHRRYRPEYRPPRSLGDRDELTRAVRNLLDNAARHARSIVSVTLVRAGRPRDAHRGR